MTTLFKFYLGKLLNLAGWPGMVRECEHGWAEQNIKVTVRKTELYTIVTVNDIDVYFRRLTGSIDGTGRAMSCGIEESQNNSPTSAQIESQTPQPILGTQSQQAAPERSQNPSETLTRKLGG